MKKWNLICSIGQLVFGVLAILSFIILWIGKESMDNWIITLVLAVILVISGITGIIDYKKAAQNDGE